MSRVNKLCINIIAFIVLNPNKYNEAIIWEDISHLFYINVFHRNLTDCMSVCPSFYMAGGRPNNMSIILSKLDNSTQSKRDEP